MAAVAATHAAARCCRPAPATSARGCASRPRSTLADLAGYDLVVAADGASSQHPRAARRDATSASTVETATAKFIWFGTDYLFDGLTFVHERSPHGVFAVHGYPISDAVSTFIVETDEASWRRAGLDEFDVTQPPGPERPW